MASSLYSALKKSASALGIGPLIDDVLARVSDRDRVFRQHRELLCQSMFQEFCRIERIDTHFYPVGGAANHSLMLVLARLCTECPVTSFLELGAGQSTLLLDVLRERRPFDLLTLESSDFWAQAMRVRVKSEIVHAPLVETQVGGVALKAYPRQAVPAGRKFDAVLVDGPTGVQRFSRAGCLEFLQTSLAEEFVVVFDDAERDGEQQTIALFEQWLTAQGRTVRKHVVHGSSSQAILATGRFVAAAYF